MGHPPSPATRRRTTSQPTLQRTADKAAQFTYTPVPRGLLLDLRDTPLAIGIYTLIMRLATARGAGVPLSEADILAYDPSLKRGQVIRATRRLVGGGWLIEQAESGKKTIYLPTWGRIGGTPRPWIADPAHSYGRPRHVGVYRVDRRLLDVCMGRLDLHERHKAVITRYVTIPISGLADAGVYALALADLHMGATTPALQRLGVLATNGAAMELPPDEVILALASQQTLVAEEHTLTLQGAAKLGVKAQPIKRRAETAQPLFFIPPDQFGGMIGNMIDHMIGDRDRDRSADTAPVSDETMQAANVEGSQGLLGTVQETKGAAPQPPAPDGGGLSARLPRSIWKNAPPARSDQDSVLDMESARLLREIGVKSLALITQLAQLPIETVQAAITTARSRPSTRDLAGVVCRMLRDFRDHGTPIPDPVRPANAGATAEEIRASFARLGYDLLEAPLTELSLTEEDLAAVDALAVGPRGEEGALETDEPRAPAVPLTPQTLSQQLRDEIRWRVDARHRHLVRTLSATQQNDAIVISCPSAAALHIVQTHFSLHLQRALESLKLPESTRIRYRVTPEVSIGRMADRM